VNPFDDVQNESWWGLRHEETDYDLALRFVRHACELQTRIEGTLEPEIKLGSFGDVLGAALWPKEEGRRDIPAWSFAWPALTEAAVSPPPAIDPKKTQTKAQKAAKREHHQVLSLPLLNELEKDTRFTALDVALPGEGRHALPVGWPMLVVAANDEHTQRRVAFPAHGPLVTSLNLIHV